MSKPWRTPFPMLPVALLSGIAAFAPSNAAAATNQFRGVNWADSRDNFQAGVLYISGLSSSDTYDSAFAVGTAIMDQFISKLGANAVRIPINEATVSQYWSTYTGAIDAVLAKGKLVFCYWDSAKSNKPPDMNAWWNMWKTVVDKYVANENAYFEIFNEPNMYSKTDLNNLYNDWITRYPTVPKGRVILDGTGNAQNVSDVGSDSRLEDCLLAVHDYSFFGSESMTKESDWENHIKGSVGSYSERTVCTEWGGPMSPGSKNGKSYDYLDYSKAPTNYFEAYIRGISNQLHSWNMGSFYWPGLRDGDWYSMTIKSGSGANITLSIPNQSGLERLQYSWTSTPGSGGTAGSGGAGAGGTTPTGGAENTGGGGGTVATGGNGPTGGIAPTGGRLGRGGSAPGGTSAMGGTTSMTTGGTTTMTTGGTTSMATGGTTAAAAGGTSIGPSGGGVSTGGFTSATGGTVSPAGGRASGGDAASSQPSSGGSGITGGAPASGSPAGGGGGATYPDVDAGPIGSDASSDEGGCGCRVAGGRSSSSTLVAFGALGVLVLCRPLRRRSKTPSRTGDGR